MAGGKKAETALLWLSNPVVIWAGAILGAGLAAYFLVPRLFNGLKVGFSDAVDGTLANLSTIVGSAPTSQDPNKRTAVDSATGLLVPGDRALSDDWDAYWGAVAAPFKAGADVVRAFF